MGNVQISQELFMQLLRFHLVEDESCEKEIKQGLEKKLDRMVMRDLYGKFKTAPTEEERERARKEYLEDIRSHYQSEHGHGEERQEGVVALETAFALHVTERVYVY